MKNKGFTLIELLAVVVVLTAIALIAIPIMLNIINKAKLGSLKDSAYGMVESANLYYAQYRPSKNIRFDIEGSNITSEETSELLKYKGSVESGTVILDKKGNITLCITDGTNSAYKNYTEKEITVVESNKCYIPDNRTVVYLEGTGATRSELTNQELTDEIAALKEEINSLKAKDLELASEKANQSDLETVSTVAASSTIDKIYPVGSIYMSMTEDTVEKVEAKFGGKWQKLENRFLLGASSTYAVNTTGGATSVSYTPAGKNTGGAVGNHTLTVSEMPSHRHGVSQDYNKQNPVTFSTGGYLIFHVVATSGESGTLNSSYNSLVQPTGGSQPHNHPFTQPTFTGTTATINTMSPYIAVYMYKRVS